LLSPLLLALLGDAEPCSSQGAIAHLEVHLVSHSKSLALVGSTLRSMLVAMLADTVRLCLEDLNGNVMVAVAGGVTEDCNGVTR